MAQSIQSLELLGSLKRAYRKRLTGILSVTHYQQKRPVYGTLKLVKGQLVSAEYVGLKGLAALEALASVNAPSVSFVESSVRSKRDRTIPDMPTLLGETKPSDFEADAKVGSGIFLRVLLTMLLITLIPLGGLWYINNVLVRDKLEAAASDQLMSATLSLSDQVSSWLDTNIRALQQAAQLPAVQSLVYEEQAPVVDALLKTYTWSSDYSVADPEGNIIVISGGVPIFAEDGSYAYNVSDREYFAQVLGGEAVGRQVVIDKITGAAQACWAVPVEGEEALIGVMIGCALLGDITSAVTDIRLGETGFARLIGENGQLIADGSGSLAESSLQSLTEHPALVEAGGDDLVFFEENGERRVGFAQETRLGWTLLVEQTYQDAFAALLEAQRSSLILLSVTLALVMAIALMLTNWLTGPIQHLTSVAEGISQGQLSAPVRETGRKDEIGALARAIERLRVSMQIAFSELNRQRR